MTLLLSLASKPQEKGWQEAEQGSSVKEGLFAPGEHCLFKAEMCSQKSPWPKMPHQRHFAYKKSCYRVTQERWALGESDPLLGVWPQPLLMAHLTGRWGWEVLYKGCFPRQV